MTKANVIIVFIMLGIAPAVLKVLTLIPRARLRDFVDYDFCLLVLTRLTFTSSDALAQIYKTRL